MYEILCQYVHKGQTLSEWLRSLVNDGLLTLVLTLRRAVKKGEH